MGGPDTRPRRIDQKRDLLEGEEGNAQRENDIAQRTGHRHQTHISQQEPAIFEVEQQQNIGAHACAQPGVARLARTCQDQA